MKANFCKVLEDFWPKLALVTVTHVLLQGEKGAQGSKGFKVTLCY